MKSLIALSSVLLVAAVTAQTTVVVPAASANSEAQHRVLMAGVGNPIRGQVIIDASHLTALVGKSITKIAFRRDTQFDEALAGGSLNVTVKLGVCPHEARKAKAGFALNNPSPTQVYQGTLTAPAAPAVTGYQGWQAPQMIELTLTTAFSYTGGALCVEIDALGGGAATMWPVDATREDLLGTVQSQGTPCGNYTGHGDTARSEPGDWVAGGTARLWFYAEPGHTAFLGLGLELLSQPIDLGPLGAPGCDLLISHTTLLAAMVSAAPYDPVYGGVAFATVQIPPWPSLLGAGLVAQWGDLGPPMATSNALVCTIASSLPTLGMAMVTQRSGDPAPRVANKFGPVIRFTAQ